MNWRNAYTAYVNLDHRVDRNLKMIKELNRVGIKAQRVRGMYPEEYKGDLAKVQKMRDYNGIGGAIGCHYSQVSIMQAALANGKDAFVLEDDVVFATDVKERLDYAADYLKDKDWDVFWLGGTYHVNPAVWHDEHHTNPELPECDCKLGRDVELTDDPRIVRTYGIWSTYAYIVNYDSIPKILKLLEDNVHLSISIDWLFIKLQPQLQTYAFVAGMAKQYDNKSNIQIGDMQFSDFAKLGIYWFSDKMDDVNPSSINWAEARIK